MRLTQTSVFIKYQYRQLITIYPNISTHHQVYSQFTAIFEQLNDYNMVVKSLIIQLWIPSRATMSVLFYNDVYFIFIFRYGHHHIFEQ